MNRSTVRCSDHPQKECLHCYECFDDLFFDRTRLIEGLIPLYEAYFNRNGKITMDAIELEKVREAFLLALAVKEESCKVPCEY